MAVTPRTIVGVNDGSDPFTDQSTSTATNSNTPSTRLNAHLEDLETKNRIIVNQDNIAVTLGGVIDSNKEYFLDGIIDMGESSIIVPTTGMTISGYSFDISGLKSSADNHTMFVSESEAIGSGNLLGFDCFFQCTGTGAKVFELYDSNGFHAIEMNRVNYNNCTSLGDIYDYRQCLENGTGRFGGSPSLTLHGTWLGGFKITTSITRSMSDTTTEPLFKAGTNFVMNSRFFTDMNVDLGSLQALLDFAPANFPNANTLQIQNSIVTRDFSSDTTDSNITPNIGAENLSSNWTNNIGIDNTFVGGMQQVSTEVETVITTIGVSAEILGTQDNLELQHFSSTVNGRLVALADNPTSYTVNFSFVLNGAPNDEYRLDLIKNVSGTETIQRSHLRKIQNLAGGRDVAYFNGMSHIKLLTGDSVYWKVTNLTSIANCTLENGSMWALIKR